MVGTIGALPPDMFVATWNDLVRGERTVLRWMPLRGKVWVEGCQRVCARNFLVRTIGAPQFPFSGPAAKRRLPFVVRAAGTLPPDFLGASSNDLVRGKRAVFCGVPLRREVGMEGGQRVCD